MKRLRVHTAQAMDGRLFLQFLALVCVSSIRAAARGDERLRHLTVREIMEEMETLVRIKYSKRYGEVYTETTPIQRRIMDVFGVELPA
jgi:hypothetical protein